MIPEEIEKFLSDPKNAHVVPVVETIVDRMFKKRTEEAEARKAAEGDNSPLGFFDFLGGGK